MPQRCLGCPVRTSVGREPQAGLGAPGPHCCACRLPASSCTPHRTSLYPWSLLPTGLLLVPSLRSELGWVLDRDGESLLLLQPSATATSTRSAPRGRVQGWGQNRALQPAHSHIGAGPFIALLPQEEQRPQSTQGLGQSLLQPQALC